MDKLMKTAKRLDTFFKVLQKIIKITMIVMVCVLGVLTVTNIVNPNAIIANGFYSVDIGPITINLAESYSPKDNNMVLTYAWMVVVLAAITGMAGYYALGQVRNILKPMSEGNPFHPTVSTNIRKIAYVSIIMGIVANVASFIETLNAVKVIEKLNLVEYVKDGSIQSITTNYNIDLTFLIVFFLLLLMSYIFRYGEELQQQVDETL
ncbi:MAG: DUF2975 domain-containing protein [Erysipelotrichales bacterium]|nr:DUF2975 domain-containing protein [Erysipelotrichales bacterium]